MDKMHTEIKSLLGLNSAAGDAEVGDVKARMSADDHRQAHALGLAQLRGRVKGAGNRGLRRQQERNQQRQQTTATRRYRREQIQLVSDRSTVIGLARVYLEGHGTPAMQKNVRDHVARLSRDIAEQRHPEVWADDTLTPDEALRAKAVALQEAHDALVARFGEVLYAD